MMLDRRDNGIAGAVRWCLLVAEGRGGRMEEEGERLGEERHQR